MISILIFAVAAVCAAAGIWQYLRQQSAGEGYEGLRAEVGTGVPKEVPESEQESVEIPIDFDSLQARNPEAYAWITIPGTAIDYPVLQSETDNTYYLTHTINGVESPEGAICVLRAGLVCSRLSLAGAVRGKQPRRPARW